MSHAPRPHDPRLRGDSALYDHDVLRWCEARGSEYGISADLSEHLRAEIQRLPETAWQVEREDPEAIRAWAGLPEFAVVGNPEGNPARLRRRPISPRGNQYW